MRIAITGGTGFIGRHFAERLAKEGHEVVTLSRRTSTTNVKGIEHVATDLSNVDVLVNALHGCDAVAHCAGINREIGDQTYQRVHVESTRNVVAAARQSGVPKIVLMSFLRARPDCGSAYHESKWAAEEIVRVSGLDYTVIKAGMVYGQGDHMLDHLSRALYTLPLFATVGCREAPIRPLAIDDLVDLMQSAVIQGRLPYQTIAVTGAEELLLSDAARRVAHVLGRRVYVMRMPVWFHYVLARLFEWTMTVPLEARAQVRMLAEGVTESAPATGFPPADLMPRRRFSDDQIRRGLPEPGAFGWRDLRCFAS